MGLRHMKETNITFMAKVGWGLISRKDDLWVKVVRAKYKCGQDLIARIKHHRQSSNLWKGISKARSLVQDGISWSLGRGDSIRF